MSVLCLPHSKSEPAIDAISSPALYWQVSDSLLHHACTGMMRWVEAACMYYKLGCSFLGMHGSPFWRSARAMHTERERAGRYVHRNYVTASCQCVGALSSLCE